MKFWSGDKIEKLQENQIFVFGSNPQARHFAGGAKAALKFGAIPRKITKKNGEEIITDGIARGLSGQTYALITKNLEDEEGYMEKSTGIVYEKGGFKSVSPEMIIYNIKEMYDCARNNPQLQFIVTYKRELWDNKSEKKSLNGYTPSEMIDMFIAHDIPENIVFHNSYKEVMKLKLESKKQEQENSFENKYFLFGSYNQPFHKQYPSLFFYKDKSFVSLEHFMVYSKLKLFNDVVGESKLNKLLIDNMLVDFKNNKINTTDILSNVVKSKEWCSLMNQIKIIGKECLNFNEDLWLSKKSSILTVGNREKITQSESVYNETLNVNNRQIIFASMLSNNSGIGISFDHPEIKNTNLWTGKNELGLSIQQAIQIIQSNQKRLQP